MAGRGPAPKDPEARVRRHKPAAGEWTELPAVPKKPILPNLPVRKRDLDDDPVGKWHPRTREAWKAWRQDPATTQFGPSEIAAAISLAYVYDEWVRGKNLAAEVRLREDGLGLTVKGKQDRRWRAPTQTITSLEEAPAPVAKLAEVRRLRAS